MNEGKPTKAKWWSRPRPQGPGATTSHQAEGTPAAGSPAGRDKVPVPAASEDGDFELASPVSPRAGGDFELDPAGLAPARAEADVDATAGAGADGVSAAGETAPADATPASAAPGGAGAPAPRPRPLHDPDPYGTPPYGEPGPWAPAPPVQHPGTTSAQGTSLPAAPSVRHGMPAPSVPPVQGAPAPAAPSGQAAPPPDAHAYPHPPATPWQRYDPWAAPGPLQQNGASVATDAQRRRRAKKGLVLGALVLALVSGAVGGVVGGYLERNGGMGDVVLPQAGKEAAGRAPDSVAGIAARALPSVVTLHVRGTGTEATGTGFVLDRQGHILTNNHVVKPAGSSGDISVVFSGGQTAKAEVIGHDTGYDLAVVKVSGVTGLQPMPLGNSDNVRVGDPVVAIGAPFDLANTVTSGIISAKERPITAGGEPGEGSDVSYVDALQTDAPINPGNSGGPLLDSQARVIGINSAIRSADSGSDLQSGQAGSIGLGFAIPVNQAKRVAEELINTGKATHPVIGVTLDMNYSGDGARVDTKGSGTGDPVIKGGPGDKAGIKAGDIITEVDGQPVHSGEELIVKTRAHRPGDRLLLTLRRGGAEKQVTLVLGSADGS